MKQSGFMKKQRLIENEFMSIGARVNRQMMADCMCILLHDQKAMGGRAWGVNKIRQFLLDLMDVVNEYFDATTGGVEADYLQEKMDRELRAIFGDGLEPFENRYPDIKKITYGLKHKH